MIVFVHAGFGPPEADDIITGVFDAPQRAFDRAACAASVVNQIQAASKDQLCGEMEICSDVFLCMPHAIRYSPVPPQCSPPGRPRATRYAHKTKPAGSPIPLRGPLDCRDRTSRRATAAARNAAEMSCPVPAFRTSMHPLERTRYCNAASDGSVDGLGSAGWCIPVLDTAWSHLKQ